uniref:Uncharacterized protein n=1 Tax=Siphoviridae sp. ctsi73 TaxID=2825698 RepID=A0A8S5QI25_9CAUD|nr:MAG TPA: hypothetical protein [Siphoviridae sp. ctsi73]DAL29848.1 MAG TPA_asm: hypothetical protein [Caudoviricetes sp.]
MVVAFLNDRPAKRPRAKFFSLSKRAKKFENGGITTKTGD